MLELELGRIAAQVEGLRREIRMLGVKRPGADDPIPARQAAGRPPASRLIEISRDSAASGRSYWLRRCEGFRVIADSHALGTVEAVRFGRHHDRPDALIVVADGRRYRLLNVPVEDIAEISHEDELITLASDPREPRPDHQGRALLGALARIGRQCRADPTDTPPFPDAVEASRSGPR